MSCGLKQCRAEVFYLDHLRNHIIQVEVAQVFLDVFLNFYPVKKDQVGLSLKVNRSLKYAVRSGVYQLIFVKFSLLDCRYLKKSIIRLIFALFNPSFNNINNSTTKRGGNQTF